MRRLRLLADTLIVAGVAAAILVWLTGGGTLELGQLRLSFHSVARSLAVAVLGVAIRVIAERRGGDALASHHIREYVLLGFPILIAVAFGLAAAWQVRACGGLDSYGYVSAASLVAEGRLKQPEPLAAVLPFESGLRALAPLGYVPSSDGTTIVPRFPLGFPLLMAPFLLIGRSAVFVVPLLCAAATVWIVYRLAGERDGWLSGAFAATLVAIDPIFFNQAIQPMSDVPATMWIVLAIWLATRASPRPVLSGAAAGMAFLTRPALLVAVFAVGASLLVAAAERARRAEATRVFLRWMAPAGAAIAAHAVVQAVMLGSPFSSGYGSAEHLFQIARLPENVRNYVRWMTVVYGPLLLVPMVGAVALRRSPWMWSLAATAAAVAAPYLFYIRFDDWIVTRFLLPGAALLMTAGACGTVRLLTRLVPPPWVAACVLILAAGAGLRSYVFVVGQGVPRLAQAESKYPRLGAWFLEYAPADAIVVSSLHSGSIRYYSGRKTIRWDEIPPGTLTATIRALAPRPCYLALDGPEEEQLFRARFGAELATILVVPEARLRGLNIVRLQPYP